VFLRWPTHCEGKKKGRTKKKKKDREEDKAGVEGADGLMPGRDLPHSENKV
jgi:hypothetical protein